MLQERSAQCGQFVFNFYWVRILSSQQILKGVPNQVKSNSLRVTETAGGSGLAEDATINNHQCCSEGQRASVLVLHR